MGSGIGQRERNAHLVPIDRACRASCTSRTSRAGRVCRAGRAGCRHVVLGGDEEVRQQLVVPQPLGVAPLDEEHEVGQVAQLEVETLQHARR
eukprot:scaffold86249_cov66-Phaeocystis_antarctica.AAC.4